MENYIFDDLLNPEIIDSIPKQSSEDIARAREYIKEVDSVRVLAIDESGRFEDINSNEYVFVGGLIADIIPQNNEDEKEAINRVSKDIIEALKKICDDYNNNDSRWKVKFPQSFHSARSSIKVFDRNTENEVVEENINDHQKNNLYRFKNDFSKKIMNDVQTLISEKNFKCFAYFLPKQTDLPIVAESNISDLSVGANLYETMLITAIENYLFYDTLKNVKTASLHIATRTLDDEVLDGSADELYSYYRKSDKKLYRITSTNSIKAFLMHKIRYGKIRNDNIHLSFNVNSINYNMNSDSAYSQAFLYLSDIVCSIIRRKFEENNISNGEEISQPEKLRTISNSFDINKYDIRMYSEADRYYRNMIDCINNVDYVEYFSNVFDFQNRLNIHKKKGDDITPIYQYYNKRLVEKLGNTIELKIKNEEYRNDIINGIPNYYACTDGMMGASSNNYEKGMFVAKGIIKIIEDIDENKGFKNFTYRDKYLFRFNDILVRGHNHRGDIKGTEKFIKKCDEKSVAVGIEEYLEHKQRAVQLYFNSLNYDDIINIYLKNLIGNYRNEYWDFSEIEKLKESIRTLADLKTDGEYLLSGKIYSTVAQAFAFKRASEADYYFKKAIEEMTNDKANKEITNSYRLHYYIDMGSIKEKDKFLEQYESVASEYFEVNYDCPLVKTLNEQFNIIMKLIKEQLIKENYEMRFALYVFVKAFRVFYSSDVRLTSQERSDMIDKIISEVIAFSKNIDDTIHPWQLIYINLFEILLGLIKHNNSAYNDRKYEGSIRYLVDRITDKERVKKEGPTVIAMIVDFKIKYKEIIQSILKDYKEIDAKMDFSKEELNKIKQFAELKDVSKETLREEFINKLSTKLTYMYN